ncbi:MAG: hypothetical protein E6Q34_06135 [Burkholderiaceae bacterium]|nr:MAG: hypothetical protein E6Q34_06135 [Burkholderiaceae bacterium]
MTFSNGVLPNDRTHQLKAFGFYEFNSELSLGANLLVQSGRTKICQGTDVKSDNGENTAFPFQAEWGGPGYGAAYMFCNGKPVPRGSLGRMPVQKQLDLILTHNANYLKGLVLGLDVFNVTNDQVTLTRNEAYDNSNGKILSIYGGVRQYTDSLTVKLRVECNKCF